jgi:hypothetical protein
MNHPEPIIPKGDWSFPEKAKAAHAERPSVVIDQPTIDSNGSRRLESVDNPRITVTPAALATGD